MPLAVLGLCLVRFADTQKSAQLTFQVFLFGFIGVGLANSVSATAMANEDFKMRRAAMRLLDYQSLFHADLDGFRTGPCFPICPVETGRVVATGVTPARIAGLIPPQRAVSVATGIPGSWDRKPAHKLTYLTHLCWAEELSYDSRLIRLN
jgi:hypothetical protein